MGLADLHVALDAHFAADPSAGVLLLSVGVKDFESLGTLAKQLTAGVAPLVAAGHVSLLVRGPVVASQSTELDVPHRAYVAVQGTAAFRAQHVAGLETHHALAVLVGQACLDSVKGHVETSAKPLAHTFFGTQQVVQRVTSADGGYTGKGSYIVKKSSPLSDSYVGRGDIGAVASRVAGSLTTLKDVDIVFFSAGDGSVKGDANTMGIGLNLRDDLYLRGVADHWGGSVTQGVSTSRYSSSRSLDYYTHCFETSWTVDDIPDPLTRSLRSWLPPGKSLDAATFTVQHSTALEADVVGTNRVKMLAGVMGLVRADGSGECWPPPSVRHLWRTSGAIFSHTN
eukprot:SAG25_NODE_354_length_9250_cov_2.824281_4_plen_340_part_00